MKRPTHSATTYMTYFSFMPLCAQPMINDVLMFINPVC